MSHLLSRTRPERDHIQVVLIHGLSVPSIIWKDVAPHLAQSGFRVLLYGACPSTPSLPTHSCPQISTAAATPMRHKRRTIAPSTPPSSPSSCNMSAGRTPTLPAYPWCVLLVPHPSTDRLILAGRRRRRGVHRAVPPPRARQGSPHRAHWPPRPHRPFAHHPLSLLAHHAALHC